MTDGSSPIGLHAQGVDPGAAVLSVASDPLCRIAAACVEARPDLAWDRITAVWPPTLLLVGGLDPDGLASCRWARGLMPAARLELS